MLFGKVEQPTYGECRTRFFAQTATHTEQVKGFRGHALTLQQGISRRQMGFGERLDAFCALQSGMVS
jgi:hypothetical protein